jgi:hypothetical protein
MKKRFSYFIFFLAALVGGCSKTPQSPTGMANWDEVRANAEAFILHGNAKAMLAHCNTSGVPSDKLEALNEFLQEWHGTPDDLTLTNVAVMTVEQLAALRVEEHKDLPENVRNNFTGPQWNIKPEKLIVFSFASKDPKQKLTIRQTVGAFQTNGLWYFATAYPK